MLLRSVMVGTSPVVRITVAWTAACGGRCSGPGPAAAASGTQGSAPERRHA